MIDSCIFFSKYDKNTILKNKIFMKILEFGHMQGKKKENILLLLLLLLLLLF